MRKVKVIPKKKSKEERKGKKEKKRMAIEITKWKL